MSRSTVAPSRHASKVSARPRTIAVPLANITITWRAGDDTIRFDGEHVGRVLARFGQPMDREEFLTTLRPLVRVMRAILADDVVDDLEPDLLTLSGVLIDLIDQHDHVELPIPNATVTITLPDDATT